MLEELTWKLIGKRYWVWNRCCQLPNCATFVKIHNGLKSEHAELDHSTLALRLLPLLRGLDQHVARFGSPSLPSAVHRAGLDRCPQKHRLTPGGKLPPSSQAVNNQTKRTLTLSRCDLLFKSFTLPRRTNKEWSTKSEQRPRSS